MELKDTIQNMVSDSYNDRLTAEIQQLHIRMNLLEDLLACEEEGPHHDVLKMQHQAMSMYFKFAIIRAAMEGVEIHLEV